MRRRRETQSSYGTEASRAGTKKAQRSAGARSRRKEARALAKGHEAPCRRDPADEHRRREGGASPSPETGGPGGKLPQSGGRGGGADEGVEGGDGLGQLEGAHLANGGAGAGKGAGRGKLGEARPTPSVTRASR